jgi:hypothetical protein
MTAEDEILSLLDPAVRLRIEVNKERYATLLALLGAWKEGVEQHLSAMEERVVVRLAKELFPEGDWRFPAQVLIEPLDLLNREVHNEMEFKDRGAGASWCPCGAGFTRPTRVQNWRIEARNLREYALVCDIHVENGKPGDRLLQLPSGHETYDEQAQLACVQGSESLVAALSRSAWAIQYPGSSPEPIAVSRYEGYLELEKAIGAASRRQKQLEAWLPPFHPYSRKFLKFQMLPPEMEAPPADWTWIGETQNQPRLIALIDSACADALRKSETEERAPLVLNAIPVAQLKIQSELLSANPLRVGDSDKIPFVFTGVKHCFAATASQTQYTAEGPQTFFNPVYLNIKQSDDPRGTALGHTDVTVYGDKPASDMNYRVQVYYECLGEDVKAPTILNRPQGQRFSVILPPFGGMNAPIEQYSDAGAKRYWYRTMLRSPMLTEGDIIELLTQIPACRDNLHLEDESVSVKLEVENRTAVERSHWENYLWPAVVSQKSLLETRADYLSKSKVSVLPLMTIVLHPRHAQLPEFLWKDLEGYVASVLSQYFMVGWYRVEGQIVEW